MKLVWEKKSYVLLFSQSAAISFESWMGDPREEMVWGRPSGRAGKKTWGEAVQKPSGEVLPCCKPRPRFQSIHNQQRASSHPTAIPPGPRTLFFALIQVCISPRDLFSRLPAMLKLYSLRKETPSCNSFLTHSLEAITSNLGMKQWISRCILPSNEFVPKFRISHTLSPKSNGKGQQEKECYRILFFNPVLQRNRKPYVIAPWHRYLLLIPFSCDSGPMMGLTDVLVGI